MLRIGHRRYELTATCATFVRSPTDQMLVNVVVEGAARGAEARLLLRDVCLRGSSPGDLVGQCYERVRGVLGPFPDDFTATICLGEHFELRNNRLKFGGTDGETIDIDWTCEMSEIGETKNGVRVSVSAACWLEEAPFVRVRGHCESDDAATDELVERIADEMDGVLERIAAELAAIGWFDRAGYHSIDAIIIAGEAAVTTELRPSSVLDGNVLQMRVPMKVEPLKRIEGDTARLRVSLYEAIRNQLGAPQRD